MVNWVSYAFFLNLVRLIYYTASETKANAKDSMQTLYSAAHQEITNQELSRCKVTLLHGGAVVNTS